jgi:hypothetical protein
MNPVLQPPRDRLASNCPPQKIFCLRARLKLCCAVRTIAQVRRDIAPLLRRKLVAQIRVQVSQNLLAAAFFKVDYIHQNYSRINTETYLWGME